MKLERRDACVDTSRCHSCCRGATIRDLPL